MTIKWSASAQKDLARLRAFLATEDHRAAALMVREVLARVETLSRFPELGTRLENMDHRDVRRLIIGDYEVRYEVTPAITNVVRIWHVREHR